MEDTEGKSTDYGKVAVAVAKIQSNGIKIELPLINEAEKGFVPKNEENRIIYSLKAINGIGDDAVELIISNRPYKSLEDFYVRMIDTKLIKNAQMVALIKAGCFNEIGEERHSRIEVMKDFIKKYIYEEKETSLTFANFKKIQEYDLVPEKYKLLVRIYNFKDYILHESFLHKVIVDESKKVPKCGYHDRYFKTDPTSTSFLLENFTEDCIVKTIGEGFIISEKKFLKEWKDKKEQLTTWITDDKTLKAYNEKEFEGYWNKYGNGSQSDWYMDSLGMYYEEHALGHIDTDLYSIEHLCDLPEEPEPYEWYARTIKGEKKQFPKYRITRICGTVISNDSKHYSITLLCDNKEVVNVKLNKGHFAYYNKRISAKLDEDSDKKTVLENSWLSRGTKLFIHGMRRGDKFFCKIYNDSIFKHCIYRIDSINEVGEVEVTTERVQV